MFDSMRRALPRGAAESHFSFGSAGDRDTGHLATEAVAAYVDGELRMGAHMRASTHLAQCAMCAAEVEAQSRARRALQASAAPRLPESLLGDLCSIPRTVSAVPDEPRGTRGRGRRRRLL